MLNILISVNKNYLEYAKTMLYSIRLNTLEDITVYLINLNLSDEDCSNFKSILQKKYNINVEIIKIAKSIFDVFPIGHAHYSIEMYFRILAQFLLPKDLDRVMWLDADIIVRKDIKDFYNQDFNGKSLIVCPDRSDKNLGVEHIKKLLELDENHQYFNSGVLLFNLNKLRNGNSIEVIANMANNLKDKLTFPDQDILNVIYQNDVEYKDWKIFNYQVSGDSRLPQKGEPYIIHYTGDMKPWKFKSFSQVSLEYWKIRWKMGYKIQTLIYCINGVICRSLRKIWKCIKK